MLLGAIEEVVNERNHVSRRADPNTFRFDSATRELKGCGEEVRL
jgi:hypothetical protein